MPHYTLVVKRKDIEYDISSEDRELIQSQIDLLFATMKTCHMASHSAFAPAEVKLSREKVVGYTPSEKPKLQEPKIQESFTPAVSPQVVSENIESPQPKIENEAVENAQEIFEPIEKPPFDLLNKAVNTIELEKQEDLKPLQEAEIKNDEIVEEVIQEDVQVEPEAAPDKPQRKGFMGLKSVFGMAHKDKVKHVEGDFSSILEEKIQKPTLELKEAESQSEDFDSFIKSKKASATLDYLIITAYYLYENERLERFSIKQLNHKLFTSMKLVVDHKTIEKAISQGYVKTMPDLTGIASITEYALTQKGEDYYLKELGA